MTDSTIETTAPHGSSAACATIALPPTTATPATASAGTRSSRSADMITT
jgi:hypothetical protein